MQLAGREGEGLLYPVLNFRKILGILFIYGLNFSFKMLFWEYIGIGTPKLYGAFLPYFLSMFIEVSLFQKISFALKASWLRLCNHERLCRDVIYYESYAFIIKYWDGKIPFSLSPSLSLCHSSPQASMFLSRWSSSNSFSKCLLMIALSDSFIVTSPEKSVLFSCTSFPIFY